MYFLGDLNGPANGHCHKSPSPQGTEVTSWCTQIWGEEFMGQNPKTPGPTWPETGPTWPKSPGLDPPFRCPFPFRTSEGHLELSLVVFLGNIQRIGLAKLSTSCSHKKIFQNKGCSKWIQAVDVKRRFHLLVSLGPFSWQNITGGNPHDSSNSANKFY